MNQNTIIETIARINAMLASDPNALVTTKAGEVNPERAYIELIQDLVSTGHSAQP